MHIPLKDYLILLRTYLQAQRAKVLWLALLMLGAIILRLVPPQIMRTFIDLAADTTIGVAGEAGDRLAWLIRLALLFIGVAVGQQVLSILALYLAEDVAWRATNDLRLDLAEHCLQLDMTFHQTHTPGEMIERLDGDVTVLANFFSQFVIVILSNSLLLVGVQGLLFQVSWLVGGLTTGFVLVSLAGLLRLRHVVVPYAAATRQHYANFYSYLEERLAGIEELRANGAVAYTLRRFYALLRQVKEAELKEQWRASFIFATLSLLAALANILALGISAYRFQTTAMTIGAVYLIFHYTAMLVGPINAITRQLEDLQRAGASISRLKDLQQTQSKIRDRGQETKPALDSNNSNRWGLLDNAGLAGSEKRLVNQAATGAATNHNLPTVAMNDQPTKALRVVFENVSFGYDGQTPVLKKISFQLAAESVLGLLGRTGSGKTTLTRLLFRLYDPDQGAIYLGEAGRDIRHLPLLHLRQGVGMVTQNVQLFQTSLRDNLTFWDRSLPDEQILAVLHDLGLGGWYRSLPDGLDTRLKAGGGLSAGEAQLLALTRIFLRDPGLVILDEASSRLDPATEARLEGAIDKLLQGRTGLIIAHRLRTVQRADEIMILEKGQIYEHGRRERLAGDPASHFAHLLRTGLAEVLV